MQGLRQHPTPHLDQKVSKEQPTSQQRAIRKQQQTIHRSHQTKIHHAETPRAIHQRGVMGVMNSDAVGECQSDVGACQHHFDGGTDEKCG